METTSNSKVSCVVNYAYEASEPDELTIKPGDVLRDVERLSGGWWRGELRGRRGMFPDNFVTVLTENATTRSGGVQGRCRAVFSYQPANPDELPLCVGDVLDVLGEVEEGWWQGKRQGRIGVFPSNFVVMLDPAPVTPTFEPAPALPPKPVKEQCRVLFPYAAVNDDELSLAEGDIVTIVSKDAPDRGWWRGELNGRVGLFPDNFVQLLSVVTPEMEEKKPDRPPSKTNALYPILNKYSEKTTSVKELTTSKISSHKENSVTKESSTLSTVLHSNKNETEKFIHNETVIDGAVDGQIKRPPVPIKKSPTPTTGVGGLLSGLKSKMMPSNEKEKSSSTTVSSSGSSSSGEWDRPDGNAGSRPTCVVVNANSTANANANTNANANANTNSVVNTNTNTFDHVERNSILNDPRAGRVKAPRRRPPSQVFRDDITPLSGLSNGHEDAPTNNFVAEKPLPDKAEEIRPRTREWEKHKAPWMEELKLNQAKKTSFGSDGKSRSVSTSSSGPDSAGLPSRASTGSTDRILDCGLEEKKSTHSIEMSKSTSSISSRMTVLENFEETKVRQNVESIKKETVSPKEPENSPKPNVHSPTAAGRTLLSMLDEVKKPAPSPPSASVRTTTEIKSEISPNKTEKIAVTSEKIDSGVVTKISSVADRTTSIERLENKMEEKSDKITSVLRSAGGSSLERRIHGVGKEKSDGVEALVTELNNRISNLEKLLEAQNDKFNAAIEQLTTKLKLETDKRLALQLELEKLAQCVTQV